MSRLTDLLSSHQTERSLTSFFVLHQKAKQLDLYTSSRHDRTKQRNATLPNVKPGNEEKKLCRELVLDGPNVQTDVEITDRLQSGISNKRK